ncbi:hypothetical protein ANCDUO_07567 [Ancylostoma duodenale]|uniref:Uncharacterized protein n=1 Tax=Ancylostoma duodenale TaxID=51022 RepID=A0A0C2GYD6_9BILA|nr:hypothetical protein ANCDUO_07567 [Ancylostoma duodenale]
MSSRRQQFGVLRHQRLRSSTSFLCDCRALSPVARICRCGTQTRRSLIMVNSGRCTVRRWSSNEHIGNIELEIPAGGKQTRSEEPLLRFKVAIGDINR